MTKILGLDPGYTTGWAMFVDEEMVGTGVVVGGVEGFRHWVEGAEGREALYEADVVVIEDFDIDGTKTGSWSSEIIGAVKFVVGKRVRLFIQKRSQKTGLVGVDGLTGEQAEVKRFAWLKAHGFENVGGGHNLDAITHIIVWGKTHMRTEFYRRYFS